VCETKGVITVNISEVYKAIREFSETPFASGMVKSFSIDGTWYYANIVSGSGFIDPGLTKIHIYVDESSTIELVKDIELTVIPTPTQELAYTNQVFVSPDVLSEFSTRYAVVNGKVFKVAADISAKPGQIAMNSFQRKFAETSEAECVKLLNTKPSVCTHLSLEFDSIVKFNGTVNIGDVTKHLKEVLNEFPFAYGMINVFKFEGTAFSARTELCEGGTIFAPDVTELTLTKKRKFRTTFTLTDVPKFVFTQPTLSVQKFYVKFLKKDNVHRGMTYKLGLNEDVLPFDGTGYCRPGGIYLTEIKNMEKWRGHGTKLAIVSISVSAKVHFEECGTKLKASKIFIHTISEESKGLSCLMNFLESVDNRNGILEAVSMKYCSDWKAPISFLKKQTPELCAASVKAYPGSLGYVLDQTPELCMTAVILKPETIRTVRVQTPELCLAAVTKKGDVLSHVRVQTPEICLAAVTNSSGWGDTLLMVRVQTPEICLAAVNKYPGSIKYVRDQTPDICLAAVKNRGLLLKFVKEQTPEICLAAITSNVDAFEYVKDQTPEICLAVVKKNRFSLKYVKDQTPEMCLAAVTNGPQYSVKNVRDQTVEICLAAVNKYGSDLFYCVIQTPEICKTAVANDATAIKYVWDLKMLE